MKKRPRSRKDQICYLSRRIFRRLIICRNCVDCGGRYDSVIIELLTLSKDFYKSHDVVNITSKVVAGGASSTPQSSHGSTGSTSRPPFSRPS